MKVLNSISIPIYWNGNEEGYMKLKVEITEGKDKLQGFTNNVNGNGLTWTINSSDFLNGNYFLWPFEDLNYDLTTIGSNEIWYIKLTVTNMSDPAVFSFHTCDISSALYWPAHVFMKSVYSHDFGQLFPFQMSFTTSNTTTTTTTTTSASTFYQIKYKVILFFFVFVSLCYFNITLDF